MHQRHPASPRRPTLLPLGGTPPHNRNQARSRRTRAHPVEPHSPAAEGLALGRTVKFSSDCLVCRQNAHLGGAYQSAHVSIRRNDTGADQSSEANYLERVTFGAVTNPYPSGCPGMTEPMCRPVLGVTNPRHKPDSVSRNGPQSVSTNGSKRPKSRTWHRLAVWTVGALGASPPMAPTVHSRHVRAIPWPSGR